MSVNLLLQNAQLITKANNLVKEDFERNFFGLQRGVCGVQNQLSLVPSQAKFREFRDAITADASNSLEKLLADTAGGAGV